MSLFDVVDDVLFDLHWKVTMESPIDNLKEIIDEIPIPDPVLSENEILETIRKTSGWIK